MRTQAQIQIAIDKVAREAAELVESSVSTDDEGVVTHRDLTELEAERIDTGIPAELDELREELAQRKRLDDAIAAGSTEGPTEDPTPIRSGLQVIDGGKTDESELQLLDRARSGGVDAGELRSAACRSIERTVRDSDEAGAAIGLLDGSREVVSGGSSSGQEDVARHVLAYNSDEYRSLFFKTVKARGRATDLTPAEQRALTLAGGLASMVPVVMDPTIVETPRILDSPIGQLARRVTLTNGNRWYDAFRTTGTTARYSGAPDKGEAKVVAEGALTTSNAWIDVHRVDAFLTASIEALQDVPGLEAALRSAIARAFVKLDAEKFMTGTGTNECFGFLTRLEGSASEVLTDAVGVFAAQDLLDLRYVEAPLDIRETGQWLHSDATTAAVRLFDSDGTRHHLDLRESTVLGRPYTSTDRMSTAPGTTGESITAYGDFNDYVIVDRLGTSLEFMEQVLDPATGFPTGQRGFVAYGRRGGDVVNLDSFRLLVGQ